MPPCFMRESPITRGRIRQLPRSAQDASARPPVHYTFKQSSGLPMTITTAAVDHGAASLCHHNFCSTG